MTTAGVTFVAMVDTSPVDVWPAAPSPPAVSDWWMRVGTDSAAISLVWAVGVIIAAHLTLVGAVAVVTATAANSGRLPWIRSILNAISSDSIRRLLMVGAMVTLSAGPVGATGESNPPTPIILVDLGPAPVRPATRSPVDIQIPIETPDLSPPRSDVWVVEPGDHLWHIAKQTLESRTGAKPGISDITRYWKLVIAENFAQPDSNPDLIVPGQTIVLPPL